MKEKSLVIGTTYMKGGKNMKKTVLTLGLTSLVLGGLFIVPSTYAYQGDPAVKGPNYTQERHEAMIKAFEKNDYNTWKKLMGDRPVTKKVTAANFAKFSQAHKLALAGKTDEAKKIRAELGLGLKNGNGQRTGMGYGRNK